MTERLTPYQKRATYKRTIRRNRRRQRCGHVEPTGYRCTAPCAVGSGYCLLHNGEVTTR